MRVRYTELAKSDIRAVERYSRLKFGSERAKLYLKALRLTCQRLAPENPVLWRDVEGFPGIFRVQSESHFAYMRKIKRGFEVVRILHTSMDADAHL
jgi:plasmid stabilization system protein ParE